MNKFSLRIFLLLIVSAVILGLVTHQVTTSIRGLILWGAEIDDSNQLLIKLDTVVAKMREAQAQSRGYLLTQERPMLSKYKSSTYAVEGSLADLKATASAINDTAQLDRIVKFSELARLQITDMDTMLAVAEGRGAHQAIEKLRMTMGAPESESLNSLVNQIDSAERSKLTDLRERANTGVMTTVTMAAGGAAACVAIFLLLFWLIDREGVRRSRGEESLKELVRQMERIQLDMQQMGKFTDYLQSCREMEEIYALVGGHLAQLFPEMSGMLGVYNNARNVVEIVTHWGADVATPDQNYFLAEDCWALRRGTIHLVHANGSEPHCPHMQGEKGNTICFPMVAHGETIGMLHVVSPSNTIDARVEQILRSVSEHISMAIANMRLERTLRIQSLRDPLTQLYNRRYMETSLEREVFRAKRNNDCISIIMIDIDHFKRFNDQFGHEAGDFVLQEFAKLLKKSVRDEDIACRYGGEEFILIMPSAALHIACNRAEKLRSVMEGTELNHNGTLLGNVTLSLGILTYPEHSDDPAELIKKADEALYRAKNGGRNRIEIASPKSE